MTAKTRAVCHALCQSGKFEAGQGGCAAICMSMLGSSRGGPHGCSYSERVHGKLADAILAEIARVRDGAEGGDAKAAPGPKPHHARAEGNAHIPPPSTTGDVQ